MRRHLLLTVTALLLLLTSCGDSGGSDADGPNPTTSTSSAGTGGSSSKTTTTVAEVEGDLLEAGDLPTPWVAATDTAVHTFKNLGREGASAASVTCPKSITDAVEGNTQCAAYTDEGGPYVGLTVAAPDGTPRTTTLLCQTGDAESLDFTAFATLDAKVASSGLGASDMDGRAFEAKAYTTGAGSDWFVIRRPAGQDCPVLWDLGADDGTLKGVAAIGAVLLPLADGPTCVFVVPEGLRTRPPEAGFCMP